VKSISEIAKPPRIERTSGQKAEELRLRAAHRAAPVRAIPTDTVSGEDAARLLAFAAALRAARESKGLSIEQLAELAKVDATVLARFESGQSFNPAVSVLCRTARALGGTLGLSLLPV